MTEMVFGVVAWQSAWVVRICSVYLSCGEKVSKMDFGDDGDSSLE